MITANAIAATPVNPKRAASTTPIRWKPVLMRCARMATRAVALHFMYCNFCKLHEAHRLTPAMAAGVTDRFWEVADIVLDDWEALQ